MSVQETLRERTKKATEASREQVYAYIGANDYWYERARRRPAVLHDLSSKLQELPSKLRGLTDDVDVRHAFEPYAPAKIKETVQDRISAARKRRKDMSARGEAIVHDWHKAVAVKDVDSLVDTVRAADGASDLAKSLRTWMEEFPPEPTAKPVKKAAARKTTAHKVAEPTS